ncbi:hypothetical protein [Dactylosporangium sp. CA-092794]|uniref:hypothetical protein n=1 Tax=Dactylosporangium sp. CA-092794 TaxID=3239929 RepID=UPI003D9192D9
MKPVRTNQPYLRLALMFATVAGFLLAGAPARAEPGDVGVPVRDDGMPIVVVVSGSPESTTSPAPGGGGGGGGGLPKTGLNILLIAGAGAGLVALGAAVRVAAGRRRLQGGSSLK